MERIAETFARTAAEEPLGLVLRSRWADFLAAKAKTRRLGRRPLPTWIAEPAG